MSHFSDADLLNAIRKIAVDAGAAILIEYAAYGASGDSGAAIKGDGSPVTLADAAAEAVIVPALRALTPDIPVISEESAEEGAAFGDLSSGAASPQGGAFWLVDPLDGTKEYLKRNGEFTVNIALIRNGAPALGVVYAPALGEGFAGIVATPAAPAVALRWAAAEGEQPMRTRTPPAAGLTVVGSRSHGDADRTGAFLAQYKVAEQISCGSSLKFCAVAAGRADLYPRFGPTCLWDTAAGHAVLAAAGGRVETADGAPLTYGPRPRFLNPDFIAYGQC